MVFFLCIPFESKLSTVSIKTKTPFGVVVFCLIVELAGQKSNFFEEDLLKLLNLG
jgi:flagellar motor component MotA